MFFMQFLKKIFKICSLIFLILFASIGVGLAGGVPIVASSRKENKMLPPMELVDTKENDADWEYFEEEE